MGIFGFGASQKPPETGGEVNPYQYQLDHYSPLAYLLGGQPGVAERADLRMRAQNWTPGQAAPQMPAPFDNPYGAPPMRPPVPLPDDGPPPVPQAQLSVAPIVTPQIAPAPQVPAHMPSLMAYLDPGRLRQA